MAGVNTNKQSTDNEEVVVNSVKLTFHTEHVAANYETPANSTGKPTHCLHSPTIPTELT